MAEVGQNGAERGRPRKAVGHYAPPCAVGDPRAGHGDLDAVGRRDPPRTAVSEYDEAEPVKTRLGRGEGGGGDKNK